MKANIISIILLIFVVILTFFTSSLIRQKCELILSKIDELRSENGIADISKIEKLGETLNSQLDFITYFVDLREIKDVQNSYNSLYAACVSDNNEEYNKSLSELYYNVSVIINANKTTAEAIL